MTINSQELLKRAFVEAMCQKCDEDISIFNENTTCSAEHRRRIRQIVKGSYTPIKHKLSKKKTMVAILIAAALLLAGCTVYAYREQLGNFFVEFFDEYTIGIFDNGEKENISSITEIYNVGYVPDGYVLKKETIHSNRVTYTWQNESGEIISFEQKIHDQTKHYADGKTIEINELKFGEYKVYFMNVGSAHSYLWEDGEYIFVLRTTGSLFEKEIIQIIESISVKQ